MDTSYLSQQVTTIINQLHGYFDEIGVASHERDSRESEVATSKYSVNLFATDRTNSFSRPCRKLSTIN